MLWVFSLHIIGQNTKHVPEREGNNDNYPTLTMSTLTMSVHCTTIHIYSRGFLFICKIIVTDTKQEIKKKL